MDHVGSGDDIEPEILQAYRNLATPGLQRLFWSTPFDFKGSVLIHAIHVNGVGRCTFGTSFFEAEKNSKFSCFGVRFHGSGPGGYGMIAMVAFNMFYLAARDPAVPS